MRYFTTQLYALKKALLILIIFLTAFTSRGQNLTLTIAGANAKETKIIDSLSYNRSHENAKSIVDENVLLSLKLLKNGYLENRQESGGKVNDSVFFYTYALGPRTSSVLIYTGRLKPEEKLLLDLTGDTLTLDLPQVEDFMNNSIATLERKGYSLSAMQLIDYTSSGGGLNATLQLKTEKIRTLDELVLEGYPKFPEGIRRNIKKQYRGKVFNQQTLKQVHNDFNALRFVTQPRYPEILFKKDTTKVYVYLEKAKPNVFDGFIGFSNDEESKIIFTGYVDLLLNNVLNTGEKFNLFWKSDGNEQTTFDVSLELPYIFKSPIGIKAALRIFKQDSTFQNTVTDVNIGYYFSYNSKLYIGHQATQSVDIQNLNSTTLSDYSNSFFTSMYEYADFNIDDFLFPEKTALLVKAGTGKRDAKTGSSDQYFAQLNLSHNLYLNKKNLINIKSQGYYLNSRNYIINELYRFGGINSIRGFNENSLQANLYGALMAEYRYVLGSGIYVHSITDYGFYQDKTASVRENLLGLGFGFGLLTKTGLFNIVYANGSTGDSQIKLSNSIVHISVKARF